MSEERSDMTTDKATQIIHSFVMSDSFDELLIYRLEKSLEWTMAQLKDHDYDPDEMLFDLQYCRSLIMILRNFSVDDYKGESEVVDSFNEKLLADYY